VARAPRDPAPTPHDLFRPPATPVGCGEIEAIAAAEGWGTLVGLDEAGRGPLAGPVVAAACVLSPEACATAKGLGLDDSKRMSEAARERLFEWLNVHATAKAVALIDPATIDAMNILRASLHGMRLAWDAVIAGDPSLDRARVLVDGRDRAPLPPAVRQLPLIKGDARSLHIAAASVLAKVTRDRIMVAADADWPGYGFAKHKGYPTLAHRRAIAALGPCPLHRRSFTLLSQDAATPTTPSPHD
jgi:ribonuclease HII